MEEHYKQLLSQYPFISYVTYGGNEYIGIIQNFDEVITTIYDFGLLREEKHKKVFLSLGETWWWESNRMVPINIFLKAEWSQFRPTLKTFNSKDVELKYGPALSLKESAQKRSKRRSITLVKRLP